MRLVYIIHIIHLIKCINNIYIIHKIIYIHTLQTDLIAFQIFLKKLNNNTQYKCVIRKLTQ